MQNFFSVCIFQKSVKNHMKMSDAVLKKEFKTKAVVQFDLV